MIGARTAVVALLVAGLLVWGSVVAFSSPIPDVNEDVNSIGYADLTVTVLYTLVGSCEIDAYGVVQGCLIGAQIGDGFVANEHLTSPSGPATVFRLPVATLETQCTSRVRISLSGPGVNGVVTQDISEKFSPNANVAHKFGHIYFSAQGSHGATVEAWVADCYGYATDQRGEDKVLSTPRTINFDGKDDL